MTVRCHIQKHTCTHTHISISGCKSHAPLNHHPSGHCDDGCDGQCLDFNCDKFHFDQGEVLHNSCVHFHVNNVCYFMLSAWACDCDCAGQRIKARDHSEPTHPMPMAKPPMYNINSLSQWQTKSHLYPHLFAQETAPTQPRRKPSFPSTTPSPLEQKSRAGNFTKQTRRQPFWSCARRSYIRRNVLMVVWIWTVLAKDQDIILHTSK